MRRWVVAGLLLLPFGVVPALAGWLAEREAVRLAHGLWLVSDAFQLAEPRQKEADRDEVALWRAQLAELWEEPSRPAAAATTAAASRASVSRRAPRSAPPTGLFVSAERVLMLARQGARPSGIRVPATQHRPGGLMLMGVSGLGVGLEDGDILTHAVGQPAVSEEAVVSAVIRARGARQPQLSGRVWRDGTTFALVVAQPYFEPS